MAHDTSVSVGAFAVYYLNFTTEVRVCQPRFLKKYDFNRCDKKSAAILPHIRDTAQMIPS